jgi:hypothetical protein
MGLMIVGLSTGIWYEPVGRLKNRLGALPEKLLRRSFSRFDCTRAEFIEKLLLRSFTRKAPPEEFLCFDCTRALCEFIGKTPPEEFLSL